ncbi:MAG: restriction endonuclease [archaeon]
MTNYRKGYKFEYRLKTYFEKNGFLVLRSPASKSPLDLVVISKNKDLFFIQCKKSSKDKIYVYNLKELLELAKRYKAKPLLAFSFNRTKIFIKEIEKDAEILSKENVTDIDSWFKSYFS